MSYSLNKAPLEGFAIVLPFSFNAEAQLSLLANRAVVLAHLRLSPSATADFPAFSAALTKDGGVNWVLRNAQGNEVIQLRRFRPEAVLSGQSVGGGDSFLRLMGQESRETGIEFPALPAEKFPTFKADGVDRFAWGGTLHDGEREILRISECVVDLDLVYGGVRSFVAAGPVRGGIDPSVFRWLVGEGHWLRDADDGQGGTKAEAHPSDVPLSAVTLNDLRRRRSLTFFGADDFGKNQAANAKGAVFFACGSFARHRTALHLQHLAVAAHEGSARAHEAAWRNLAVPPLEESVKEGERREASQDVLFEGMAVWGLNLRQSGTTVQAAKPLLL